MAWKEIKQKLRWLDPFTYSDLLLKKIGWEDNGLLRFITELVTAFVAAFLLYSIIGFVMGTAMPLVIVLSGSMEPVLHRGDIVLLQGAAAPEAVKVQSISLNRNLSGLAFSDFGSATYFLDESNRRVVYSLVFADQNVRLNTEGDIVVYFSQQPGIPPQPIIHRAVLRIHANDGDFFLTKGDSIFNPTFDQDCGRVVLGQSEKACITLYPIKASELQGKTVGFIPLVGYVKLILVDDLAQFLQGCPKTIECPSGCCFP